VLSASTIAFCLSTQLCCSFADQSERTFREESERQAHKLINKLDVIGRFASVYSPSQFADDTGMAPATGKVYNSSSNGLPGSIRRASLRRR
jgi:hypothetical protein